MKTPLHFVSERDHTDSTWRIVHPSDRGHVFVSQLTQDEAAELRTHANALLRCMPAAPLEFVIEYAQKTLPQHA